jgi:site-specific DNA-methyltransferase (adenine-specific)
MSGFIAPNSVVTHEDCMALMARYPDKYFDLAVVDPPYGIGESGSKNSTRVGGRAKARIYKDFAGNDKKIPELEYFQELFRVSKNQVIWGANYMVEYLPPSMGWIFWDKDTWASDFSDGELAYTSFKKSLKRFKYTWAGFRQGPTNQCIEDRIHPTQKPVALYDWIFKNYAKEGDKILDTHLGSGSSRISAWKAGLDFTACELDADYFAAQEKRFKEFTAQMRLF